MTNKEFADAILACGENLDSVSTVVGVIASKYEPVDLVEFKRQFDIVTTVKWQQSLLANIVAWERATYINAYLKHDMFTEDGDYKKNLDCQILNSQAIIDRTKEVLKK